MRMATEVVRHRRAFTGLGLSPGRCIATVCCALFVMAALPSCRAMDDVTTDTQCANLDTVSNPSLDELDAQWDRLIDLELPALRGSATTQPSEVVSQHRQMRKDLRADPAWRDLVASVPPGGVGKHRMRYCQLLTGGQSLPMPTSPGEIDDRAAGARILQLVKDEPYFALYFFGPVTCMDFSHLQNSESDDSVERQMLCPVKRVFGPATTTPR